MKKIILSGMIGLLAVSCTSMNTTKPDGTTVENQTSNTNLLGSSWVLNKVDAATSKKPTLIIENQNISGNGGCNNFTGYLELDQSKKSFKASRIASTRMACRGTNEPNYLKMLEEANNYKVKGNQLHLYKDNLLLLTFDRN